MNSIRWSILEVLKEGATSRNGLYEMACIEYGKSISRDSFRGRLVEMRHSNEIKELRSGKFKLVEKHDKNL